MFLVILLYALLALAFTLAKVSVSYANPLFLIAVRMLIAGPLLLSIYWIQRYFKGSENKHVNVNSRDLFNFVQVIFFHIYLAFVPEFWALQYVSSVKVNIMYATTPFIAMFLSYMLYQEKVTVAQLIGACVGFLSLFPLMLPGEGCVPTLAIALPELVLLAAIACSAYAWFVIKRLMDRGYSLAVINGVSMLLGGVLSAITWGLVCRGVCEPIYAMQPFLISLVALIIVSNIGVYNLYGWLVRKYSINTIAIAGFMCPVFGAILGVLLLSESFAWQHAVAIAGISCGLYLFFARFRAKSSLS
jgi:drug/metabolite transporter (DMT)-like permease